MWAEALALAGLGVASAVIPLINIEAILVLAASQDRAPGWLLILGATVGQMLGKLLWYHGGRELERFAFVARRMQRPRAEASMERWQRRSAGRPWFTAGLLFLSASVGIAPYAVLAVVAGAGDAVVDHPGHGVGGPGGAVLGHPRRHRRDRVRLVSGRHGTEWTDDQPRARPCRRPRVRRAVAADSR